MDRIFIGDIHKCTFGVNPGADGNVGYTVGYGVDKKHPSVKVSSITVDDTAYQENGHIVCRIWVVDQAKDKGVQFVYKTFVNIPFVICSDID